MHGEELNVDAILNEQVIVARAQRDGTAFTTLYDHYFPRVYSYVLYRVQEPPAAADITSEVFERAFKQINRYNAQRGAFSTWLFTIARNAIKNHYRRKAIRQWVPLDAIAERADARPQPEAAITYDEQLQALLAAVADLPEREREIIALKFGAEETNRRIAEMMGLTESNVAVILYRTVRKLRATLEGGTQ